jgi:hypothetical protein
MQNNVANVFRQLHNKKTKCNIMELTDEEYAEMFGE